MNSSPFVPVLKRKFSTEVWPWTFAALWQDSLVWDCLENTDLGERALAELPGDPLKWTPASLAMIDLQTPLKVEEVRTLPSRSIPTATLRLARHTAREWQNLRARSGLRMGQLGLLALALVERSESAPWRQVWNENEAADWLAREDGSAGTLLACLYDLVPEPLEMLRALFSSAHEGVDAAGLVVQAVLSQPLPPGHQAETFTRLLDGLNGDQALRILRGLAVERPDLARSVSAGLNAGLEPSGAGALAHLHELLQSAGMKEVQGDFALAVPLLEEALENARSTQAWLAAMMGELAGRANEHSTSLAAWKQAALLDSGSPFFASELALALSRSGQVQKARAYLAAREQEMLGHPRLKMAGALVARQMGDVEKAARLGQEALEGFARRLEIEHEVETGNMLGRLTELSQAFLDLGRPAQAAQAARLALKFSRQAELPLDLLVRSQLEQGEAAAVLAPVHMLAVLKSASGTQAEAGPVQQMLVESLEQAEAWDAALEERRSLMAGRPGSQTVSSREWRGLAHCAVRAGKLDQAITAAREALKLNAEDDAALALLGQAYQSLGDLPAAGKQYRQAAQLAPHEAGHWLALSAVLEQQEQPEQVVETLRAASQAAPQAPEVHLALGEALLREKTPSQALPALRRASDLLAAREGREAAELVLPGLRHRRLPDQKGLARRAALGLGKALHQLGHFGEAEQVLSGAYDRAEADDTETAYAFAKTLLSLGEVRRALAPLERVVRSEPDDAAPYLAYGRALLQSGEHLQAQAKQAAPALRKAIELGEPGFAPEARALLAEALLRSGELEESQEAFRLAMNTHLKDDPSWHSRLAGGFGRVSLRLGQLETAIAALQEAALASPQNAVIQRDLSDAFLAQGLEEEALAAARHALNIDPAGLDTLVWFAEQTRRFKSTRSDAKILQREAVQAWQQASQLAPERGDVLVCLAKAYLQAGDREAARAALELVRAAVNDELPESRPGIQLDSKDLHQAARLLRDLGEDTGAIFLLQTAVQKLQSAAEASSTAPDEQARLMSDLAAMQAETGLLREALTSVEAGLRMAPDHLDLKLQKASLLVQLDEDPAALAFLEAQLKAAENNPGPNSRVRSALHRQASIILRQRGELNLAQAQAERAVGLVDEGLEPAACYLAASLARACLQAPRASELLERSLGRLASLDCLAAELALEEGDLAKAGQIAATAETLDNQAPRVLLLRSRLLKRSGQTAQAVRLLDQAASQIRLPDERGHLRPEADVLDSWLALGTAALDLHRWEIAIKAFRLASKAAPAEPFAQLQWARALVLRAEAQQLCLDLEVVTHAPGSEALSEAAYGAFHIALKTLTERAGAAGNGTVPAGERSSSTLRLAQQEANRWRARGEAAFRPGSETVRSLAAIAENAEDTAALVAALRRSGDPRNALKAAQSYPADPGVLVHMAMTVGENSPAQALSALVHLIQPRASQTAPAELVQDQKAVSEQTAPAGQDLAFTQALAARLALRAGDYEAAGQAIRAALEIYPDEPRWHALAAQVCWNNETAATVASWAEALEHLKTAVSQEPDYAGHYLALGQVQQASGDLKSALATLEEGSRLAPTHFELWTALAQAQIAGGNLQAAADSAENAIETSPDPTDALLLRGEIALMADNPRGALSRAQSILRSLPDHPGALYMMAEAYEQMDRPDEALEVLDQVIRQADAPLELELKRAELVRLVRGKAEGMQAYKTMAARYPEQAGVLARYAEALLENGDASNAVQVARLALQCGGCDLTRDVRGHLHYLIGRQLRKEGQLDQSIHHLSESIQQSPNLLEAMLELGQAQQGRRQHALAISAFEKAIQTAPNDPRAYYQAGMALKENKDYLGAESMLRRAAGLAPDDVSIHRLLGAVVALNLVHNRRPEFGSES